MKKDLIIKLGALAAIGLLTISGVAMAKEDKTDDIRLVVHTTSLSDKEIFENKGCSIVHELREATALKCPKGVQIEGAVEDIVYHAMDNEANNFIKANQVWTMSPTGYTGKGVTIAVIDTGVDIDHPEWVGDILQNIAGGMNFIYGTADPTNFDDDNGHGTHVAGIIIADKGDARGVAPDAKVWAGKVLDKDGNGLGTDIVAAIEHVVNGPDGILGTADDHVADVISMSLGGGNNRLENCDDTGDVMVNAVNWANSNGIPVVVASGNDMYYVSYPACASGPIAVGATDKVGRIADFSNYGPALDIVAPGVDILSTVPTGSCPLCDVSGYKKISGTSMATPMVAGVLALIMEKYPGIGVDELKTRLYSTTQKINSDSTCYSVKGMFIMPVKCTSQNYGAGIVDAYGAVNYVPGGSKGGPKPRRTNG